VEVSVFCSPAPISERAARAALSVFRSPEKIAARLADAGPAALWEHLASADQTGRLAEYRPEPELSTALRFYESAGLLPAERTPAGYRVYTEESVERLSFIAAAKHLGLPLEEIAELLTLWDSGSCAQVRADLRPRVADRIADAQSRIAELEAFTVSLHQALEHLDALPDRDGRCDPECGFLAPDIRSRTPVPVTLSASREAAEAERWRTASVACSLTGESLTERTSQWHQVLDGATGEPITDGVRLTLPAQRAGAVAALAASEQECCPFFDFRLRLDGTSLHLEVRAPAEGTALLAELFTAGSPNPR
jgi:DNA-binding transcriptional MerR regulator